ncbi:phage holin family protein [Mesorhizobium sp. M0203]|uniref:phage holin family protein n=1 Tax=Mesorhizobium sp. M0203 TaxID=2956912 RepID=UPI00333BCC73
MAHDQLKNSTLPRALSDAAADLADLVQKELRLVRAELSENVFAKLRAGIWMSAAGVLGLIAGLLTVQAVVFWIASFGIVMHWSCLIVAGVVAAAGALAYYKGRMDAQKEMTPTRSIHQIKQDISITNRIYR